MNVNSSYTYIVQGLVIIVAVDHRYPQVSGKEVRAFSVGRLLLGRRPAFFICICVVL